MNSRRLYHKSVISSSAFIYLRETLQNHKSDEYTLENDEQFVEEFEQVEGDRDGEYYLVNFSGL